MEGVIDGCPTVALGLALGLAHKVKLKNLKQYNCESRFDFEKESRL